MLNGDFDPAGLGGVGDPKFLISSQMVLMLLVFERQGIRAVGGFATGGCLTMSRDILSCHNQGSPTGI